MPEGLEAEIYRRAVDRVVGHTIAAIDVDDRQSEAGDLREVLPGIVLCGTRRIGKLVLIDTDGPTIGLHFGMTGRLVVGDAAPIDRLEYSSGRDDPSWDRLVIHLADGRCVRVNDPRRWARFTLDPDERRLGPDFLTIEADDLIARFGKRRAAIKSVLLDQSVVAGFGNLSLDEVLWQVGIAPSRPTNEVSGDEVVGLVSTMRPHLERMLELGGSHRGTIDPDVRRVLPPCPRDGTPLRRDTVGGRTTVWCPSHQT